MEEKIEVGEYVRTKDGRIDKVEIFSVGCVWHCENGMCIDECNHIVTHLEEIVKHSKQLIDLIEIGDIVEIRTGLYSSFKYFVENEDDLLLLEEKVKQFWKIKTILTKESYMTNCYQVGGENGI